MLFQNNQLCKSLTEKYFPLPSYVTYILIYLKDIIGLQMEKYMSTY